MKAIIVVSDSLRRDHLGCYGNQWIHTPNIDGFAKESTIFDFAYQSSHPTVPNRTDLFTGRYNFPWRGWSPLSAQLPVLSQVLGENKITSMLIGDTYHLFKENYYFQRGFTGWFWIRGQEGDNLVIDNTIPVKFPCAKHKIREPYSDRYPQIIRNRYHRKVEEDWFTSKTYTVAMNWLEKNYTREDFLLWIDEFDPHEPWDPPQDYIDMYDPDYNLEEDCDYPEGAPCTFLNEREVEHIRARYAGEITMVDKWFGLLLRKIKDLGIYKETLLIFLSDHGHYFNYPGDGGLIGKPLDYKGEFFPMYQSLLREPFLVKLPGSKSGIRIKEFIQPPDLLPSLLEYYRIKSKFNLHGQSFLPLIKGKEQIARDFAISGAYDRGVINITTKEWSYCYWQKQRSPVLFNLLQDPKQEHNLIEKEKKVAKKLHFKLSEFLASIEAPKQVL